MSRPRLEGLLTAAAERVPELPALRVDGAACTYGDLERLANRVARLLMDQGARPGDRIAFVATKSVHGYATLYGALKAGLLYVPLDPQGPAPRIAEVLRACEPRCVLADEGTLPMVREALATSALAQVRLGQLSPAPPGAALHFEGTALGAMAEHAPTVPGAERVDAAHILFTSGSTGVPKGVVITHDNVRAFLDWAVPYFRIGRGDRISGHAPLTFDLSTFDTFGAAAAMATLHPVPPRMNLLPGKLVEFMAESRLTQWFSVPSVLTYLQKLDALAPKALPALRELIWCGEALPTPTLLYLMERLPGVRFTNLYGPTEATIASSYHSLEQPPDDPAAPIPIGRACAGEALYVLDAQGRPCAEGEIGDLHIAGAGLSPGYWQDPEKTAAAFREDLPDLPHARLYATGDLAHRGEDGVHHFHGRRDTQIKSRGYRIELGEIEAALATLEPLKESAVVAVESEGFEGTAICCAWVPAAGGQTSVAELRKALSARLPGYMLPHRWLGLEALPRLANGKVDRNALRRRFRAQFEETAS